MWELDCEESWELKNQCFWTVVLEKTLESPLDCKEIQTVHSKGDHSWVFFERNNAKAKTPILWPPHEKSWLVGKDSDAGRDWGQEEKGTTEDEMAGWHHRLDGRESEWTLGDGDGQGGLGCYDSWGRKESDTTERLNSVHSCHRLLISSASVRSLLSFSLLCPSFHEMFPSVQFSSVAQSCPTLCDPMNCNTPGLPVHHHVLEFTQTHVHRVCDAIQPSHPRSSPSPPAPNPSQHQSLFQWVNSSHEVAKVLEFQL